MDEQTQKEQIKRELAESLAKTNPNAQGDPSEVQKFGAFGLPAAMWGPFVNLLVDHIYSIAKQVIQEQMKK